MKKVFLMFAVVVSFFTSCSDGDENGPDSKVADYTVIIYGMAGGEMDNCIEGVWRETQTLLPDGKIRVLAVNKYGADSDKFSGEYGAPGEVLAFELDKNTQFETLHQEGADMKSFKLYDPANLTALLNRAKKDLPAKEYVLVFYGHGGGFDAKSDYPKQNESRTRGVLYDELLDYASMNMYELSTAISNSDIKHLKAILFNNCLMGAMEIVTEVSSYTDYIIATPFMLTSEEDPLIPMLVKNLRQTSDFETAARQTLTDSEERLHEGYVKEGYPFNGNVELLKSSQLQAVCDAAGKLVTRLCELYPTQQDAIDNATCQVYQFYQSKPFYDLLDYAGKLAELTGDSQLADIHAEMETAFRSAILQQVNIDLGVMPTLPFYSLSVVLTDHQNYSSMINSDVDFRTSYELNKFHRLAGWGSWLNTNQRKPENNPCGQGAL